MVHFKSWEQFDEMHNKNRRLILVGDAKTCHCFIRYNKLTPAFELDYEEMCNSFALLTEEECDIIVSYLSTFEICRVVIKLEHCNLKEGSVVYLYHKFDIKTGTYCDCNRRVLINGSLVVDGDYNFYRTGLNIEMMSESDFSLLKTAFKNPLLTRAELSTIKSDNCAISIKEGRALRTNTVEDPTVQQDDCDDTMCVYLLGGCVWSSNYSTHSNKIKQVLKRLLDRKSPQKYRVEHISNVGSNEKLLISLKNVNLRPGGIVFIGNITKPEVLLAACRICEEQKCKAIAYLFPNILARRHPSEYERRIIDRGWGSNLFELQKQLKIHSDLLDELGFLGIEAYEPPSSFFDSKDTLLLDFTGVHLGDWANEIIAEHMMNIVFGEADKSVRCKKKLEVTRSLISDFIPRINFFSAQLEIKYNSHGHVNCGAVVMACNPFTNGHKYLIEYASSRVGHLYVLVVQEDGLDFTFDERFALVKKNTSYLNNVTVIPSGEFVISNITFGDYFSRAKTKNEESRPDPSLDLLIFASFIAPSLNISTRFVGEEPLCCVTRSYNEQMKRILPEYGCNVVEVSRLAVGEQIVSASLVRKYIKEGNLMAIKPLVPKLSFDYLRKKCFSANCDWDGTLSE